MKRRTRRLMSLLMALAIVCSMVPAAMAYGSGGILGTGNFWGSIPGFEWYCPNDPLTHAHDLAYSYLNSTSHRVYCANSCGYIEGTAEHTSDCGCLPTSSSNPNNPYYGHNHTYEYIDSNSHYVECFSDSSCYYYSKKVEAHSHLTYCIYCDYNNGSSVPDNIVWSSGVCGVYYYHNPVLQYSDINYDYYSCSRCNATGRAPGNSYGVGTELFYITANTDQIEANGGYLLLTALPTYSSTVTDAQLATLRWTSSNPSVAAVNSYSSSAATGASVYIYGGAVGQATIYAQLPGTNFYASYDVTVGGGIADVNITYSLTAGKSLTLDASSFEEFWSDAITGYGELSHVVFGSATGGVGQLTYQRVGAATASTVGSTAFYVSPRYNQYGIDDVVFTPATATSSGYRTGTLTVPFTAYGTDNYQGIGSSNASYRGTLYIMVTNGEVADIAYEHTGAGLNLVAADFVNVYKSALKVTAAAPAVYIQFQNVPVNGDLYYNYAAGYSAGIKLNAANIGDMRFGSHTVGTSSIGNVTYIPDGKMGDTVKYMAYSSAAGGTPLYEGEIVFGAGSMPEVRYYANINKTVPFVAADFADLSDLRYVEYISFGTPNAGTLYKNYANGSGTRVTTGATFVMGSTGTAAVPSINTLTYVPAANFTGVVQIPFTGSNILGGDISGTVKIYVAKAFSDVSSGYSWASDYIIRLTAEGVVNGMTATTYAPGAKLKYGEALKLIMEATGTSASLSTSGHWAKNYLDKAFVMGLVSDKNINLQADISRDQVAELAAKALGLSKAGSVTGYPKPSDSTNGYVYALYNAGILNGTTEPNGKNYYYGSNTINRAEISKIICLVSDYYAANK